MVKHVRGRVSMQESVNCSICLGGGKKQTRKGYFKTNQEENKATELKCLLKAEKQSFVFFSPLLICWLPPLQLYVRLICPRRFELQAPWAPGGSSRLLLAFFHAALVCGPRSSTSSHSIHPCHPHPTLSLFWLNLIAERCLITPARTYPPRPNDSLILIPHLPAALTSARRCSLQGRVHIFKKEALFIFYNSSSPHCNNIRSQFSPSLEKGRLHYRWLLFLFFQHQLVIWSHGRQHWL